MELQASFLMAKLLSVMPSSRAKEIACLRACEHACLRTGLSGRPHSHRFLCPCPPAQLYKPGSDSWPALAGSSVSLHGKYRTGVRVQGIFLAGGGSCGPTSHEQPCIPILLPARN